jgi:ketosteroid isomerase-like protein
MRYLGCLALVLMAASTNNSVGAQSTNAQMRQQVRDAELAFARSMATRDLTAFGNLLADDAVFFGREGADHGKAAVIAAWKPLFEGPTAPFSWEPEIVEVLASGTLAFSSGPVKDPSGKQTGVFNSIWRRETGGVWKVVFDKGCTCPTGP